VTDPSEKVNLDWSKRLRIIESTAQGLPIHHKRKKKKKTEEGDGRKKTFTA